MVDFAGVIGFDWDKGNERKNEKHGVSQGEAEEVFMHHPLILPDTKHSHQEMRFHALGRTHSGRLLHISFTIRGNNDKFRIISVRDMHPNEMRIYEESQ